jgi:hypothetical protein
VRETAGTAAQFEVVASKPAFGSVSAGHYGSVQVSVGEVVLQLGAADYWTLMEILSDAARRLASADRGTGHRFAEAGNG